MKSMLSMHKVLAITLFAGLVSVAFSGCSGTGSTSTAPAATISGSAGDGPIVGGAVTVTDANNIAIASTTTDANAHYSISVPSTATLPLTITITGGTDQVTGAAPDFPLKSAITSLSTSAANTANVNPLSTLAVDEATALGGVTAAHMSTAIGDVRSALGFGVDATSSSFNPITTPITGANVASAVKANEAVAELIRRSTKASGQAIGIVITGIAEDLTDGAVDGQALTGAAHTDVTPALAAQVQSNMASISGEVIANALKITNAAGTTLFANGATKLEDAATLSNGGSTPTTTVADVPVTSAFIQQAQKAVNVAINLATATGAATTELDKLKTDLAGVTAGTAASAVTLTTTVSTLDTEADTTATNASTATSSQLSTANGIVTDTTAPNAPVINSPATNAVTNNNAPTISGTAEASSTVTVYDGTTSLGTATANSSSGAWSLTSPTLTDGAHTLTAKATDAANNTSVASASVAITVDTVAPNAPSISSPAASTTVTTATPTISGTAEAGSTVKVYNGTTLLGTATTGSGGSWSLTSATLSNGASITLTAKATDAAGNTSVASSGVAITVNTNPALAGAVIDGKVSGATLTLYSDESLTTQVGSGSTDNSGAFNLTLTVATAPDPIYIKSVGGTDIDTGLPAPTMIFVGNTGGLNALTHFNVTPLTQSVYRRMRNGASLSTAQTDAQAAFGLGSNTGTDGLYEDPTAAANTTLKTAEFKQLSAGTMDGTITAGTYHMYAIVAGGSDVGSTTLANGIADLTNPANGNFVDASISVDASGNITGSDGSGNYFTGKIVGSSMLFNLQDSTTAPTHITRVVGNIGLNGSVAGNWTSVANLTGSAGTQTVEKGVFVGSLIPSSGVNATNLATFIQNFYTPSTTTSSGNMNILARSIFDSRTGNPPMFHWGQAAVQSVNVSAGTVTMGPMTMEGDSGSIVTKVSGSTTTPQQYTFNFVSGVYVKAGTSSTPTNLLVFKYTAGTTELYLATAVGLRRGIYIEVDNSSNTHLVVGVGEEYMSKVDSVAPNPFVANASTSKTYDITVANISANMPGSTRANALTYGFTPQAVPGGMTIPANTDTTKSWFDASNTSGLTQLIVFQGSMMGMKNDPHNDFSDNQFSNPPGDNDYMRLVEFMDSGAMQGEEIDGGTVTVNSSTITLRDYPSTFVGFVHDQSSSTTPSIAGLRHFLARTIYSTDYASFQHAYVSGTLNIATAPSATVAGSATLSYTSGDGTSGTVTLTVEIPPSGTYGVYHIDGALAGGNGYIDLVWPAGGTKALYMISSGASGTVSEVGEAYLTQ